MTAANDVNHAPASASSSEQSPSPAVPIPQAPSQGTEDTTGDGAAAALKKLHMSQILRAPSTFTPRVSVSQQYQILACRLPDIESAVVGAVLSVTRGMVRRKGGKKANLVRHLKHWKIWPGELPAEYTVRVRVARLIPCGDGLFTANAFTTFHDLDPIRGVLGEFHQAKQESTAAGLEVRLSPAEIGALCRLPQLFEAIDEKLDSIAAEAGGMASAATKGKVKANSQLVEKPAKKAKAQPKPKPKPKPKPPPIMPWEGTTSFQKNGPGYKRISEYLRRLRTKYVQVYDQDFVDDKGMFEHKDEKTGKSVSTPWEELVAKAPEFFKEIYKEKTKDAFPGLVYTWFPGLNMSKYAEHAADDAGDCWGDLGRRARRPKRVQAYRYVWICIDLSTQP